MEKVSLENQIFGGIVAALYSFRLLLVKKQVIRKVKKPQLFPPRSGKAILFGTIYRGVMKYGKNILK